MAVTDDNEVRVPLEIQRGEMNYVTSVYVEDVMEFSPVMAVSASLQYLESNRRRT